MTVDPVLMSLRTKVEKEDAFTQAIRLLSLGGTAFKIEDELRCDPGQMGA